MEFSPGLGSAALRRVQELRAYSAGWLTRESAYEVSFQGVRYRRACTNRLGDHPYAKELASLGFRNARWSQFGCEREMSFGDAQSLTMTATKPMWI
jgi:hypothetical protein